MKILVLQDDLFTYLFHVVNSYANAGINPDEGLAVYQLHQAIKSAQTVSDEEIAKVKAGAIGDTPVAEVSVEAKV